MRVAIKVNSENEYNILYKFITEILNLHFDLYADEWTINHLREYNDFTEEYVVGSIGCDSYKDKIKGRNNFNLNDDVRIHIDDYDEVYNNIDDFIKSKT